MYAEDGTERARVPGWDAPLHVYARGPYLTIGNEWGPGLILEGSGVMRTTFPERTNVVSIRDPPGTAGYEFVGTYIFSTWRVSEPGLREPQLSKFRTYRGPQTVSPGDSARRVLFLRPGETIKAWTHADRADGVRHELRSHRPYLHVGQYPTAFSRLDEDGAASYVTVEERAGQTATWTVADWVLAELAVENESNEEIAVEFNVERGSGV
jgi:hypothetical protein